MTSELEKKYHRFRFYEGSWSTFDLIEECNKPGPCLGCAFNHPFCTESGVVTAQKEEPDAASPHAPARGARR